MKVKKLIFSSAICLGLFLSSLHAMEQDDRMRHISAKQRSTKTVPASKVGDSLDTCIDYFSDALVEIGGGIVLLFDDLLNDVDNLVGSCTPQQDFSQINRVRKLHNQTQKSRDGSKLDKCFNKVCNSTNGLSLAEHKPLPINPIQKPKEEFIPAPLKQIFKVKNMKTGTVQLFSVPNNTSYKELYKEIDAYAKSDLKKQEEWENYGILFIYNCFDCTAYEYEKTPETRVEEGIPALYAPMSR